MATIDVRRAGEDDRAFRLTVRVADGLGTTEHDVGLSRADHERLAREGESPHAFVRRCFDFLLAREPKESIMTSFDVSVIGRFFPEFESEISRD